MKSKVHYGYNVCNLEETIHFYENVLGAIPDFVNKERRSACLTIEGSEINLFETKGFGGYHPSLLKAFHIGYQVSSKDTVDQIYQRTLDNGMIVNALPHERFDGDYTVFIEDPNGMKVEVYFGDHIKERIYG